MEKIDHNQMNADTKKGFTLIEVISTLLLVSILAAISGMGVTQVTRAYLFVRESAGITQDSQLAWNRLHSSIINLTEIDTLASRTNIDKIALTLFRDGKDITEFYYLEGTTLQLETTLDGAMSKNILLENVTDFQINYTGSNNTGSTFNWLTGSQAPSELAKVEVTYTLSLSNGTTVPFSTSAIPRNIYRPLTPADFDESESSGLQNISCFISTSLGETMTFLNTLSPLFYFSKCYLDFWVKNSAGQFLSIAILACLAWMLYTNLKRSFEKKLFPKGQKGGALLGIVITMVVIGILGGATVSIISTSDRAAAVSSFRERAYYMAESGYRYLAFSYVDSDGNIDSLININNAGSFQVKIGPASYDSFDIFSTSYWFKASRNTNDSNLEILPGVRYPAKYEDKSVTSYIVLDKTTGREIVPYTTTYPASLDTQELSLTLTSGSSNVPKDTQIFPASYVSGTSNLVEGGTITLSNDISPFPERNAVFKLIKTHGTPAIADDDVYILLYEVADADTLQLKNIKSIITTAGNIPETGLSISSDDYVYLDQNILITTVGYAGSGSYISRSENEYYIFQPLFRVNMIIKHIKEDRMDSMANWQTGSANGELGVHSIVAVDESGAEVVGADNAMKVEQTDEKTTTSAIDAAYFNKEVQESIIELDPSFAGFDEAWIKSSMKLSYEMQVKVSFTKDNDKQLSNPLGTYMPGAVFRVRPISSGSNLREYYGLSFVRSIFKQGCAPSDPDFDDIPDEDLFDDHAQNDPISADPDDICIDNYEVPPQWNDQPPLSGVPYLMVWQQALDITEYDNGIWRRNTTGEALMLDWLSWFPMCSVSSPVTVYHYRAFNGPKGEVSTPYIKESSSTPSALSNEMPFCQWYWSGFARPYYATKKFDICDTQNKCTGACTDTDYYWVCDPGRYTGCADCGDVVALPEGWYEGRLPSTDPRYGNKYYEQAYTAYKLTDTYNIFETDTVGGKTIFGTAANFNADYLVLDPGTIDYGTSYAGDVIENTAYVFPEETPTFQSDHNYRLYLKPWVTLMTRIVELKDNFYDENDVGCNHPTKTTDEKINIIQAWFANPDDYPRGGAIQWPDNCSDCFTHAIWADNAYNSRIDSVSKGSGWASVDIEKRICERGEDEYPSDPNKRSFSLLSNQLTTPDDYATNSPSEVGLHTFGIDASDADVDNRETAYFDDFGLAVFEYAEKSGLLPGMQYQ